MSPLPDQFPLDGTMREALMQQLWGQGIGGLQRPEEYDSVTCAVMRRMLNIITAQAGLEKANPYDLAAWCDRAFQRHRAYLPTPAACSEADDWGRWVYWAWEVNVTSGLGREALAPLIPRDHSVVVWLAAGCAYVQESSGSNWWSGVADCLRPILASDPSLSKSLRDLASSRDVVIATCARATVRALAGEKSPWPL